MMRAYWPGIILIIYLVVVSCTTLSLDECRRGNWFEIGQNDGTKGRALTYFQNHVSACTKHSVKPSKRKYEDGRNFGLARYCTPLSGFKAGRYSRTYKNVCPPETQGEFIRGYELGGQFGEVEKHLGDVDHDIGEIESFLRKGKGTPEERRRLKKQLVKLGDEKIRTEQKIQHIRIIANQTL